MSEQYMLMRRMQAHQTEQEQSAKKKVIKTCAGKLTRPNIATTSKVEVSKNQED